MPRKSRWVLGIAACLSLGAVGYAAKGGGTIPLQGTFRDFLGDAFTPQDRIQSDGRGAYVDHQDGIDHSIAGDGTYVLDVNTDGPKGTRGVVFDFRDCSAPIGECKPPFSIPTRVAVTKLGTDNRVGGLTAPVSDLKAQWIIFSTVDPVDAIDKVWFVRFQTFDPGHPCAGSSGILARHPNANTWEVEAEPGDIACLQAESLQCPKCPREYHGKYHLPFKISSVRK